MLYADFAYYTKEYFGTTVSESEFAVYGRKAQRRMDQVTTGKLSFAFPVKAEADAAAVKDCLCELVDFMKKVDEYKRNVMDAVGYRKSETGELIGKVISSVTSGSESRSYTSGSNEKSAIVDAAKDEKVFYVQVYAIIRDNLSMISDANGINLLYAGPYPGERKLWD